MFLSKWGSLRHAANAAFICQTAANYGVGDRKNYTEFSVSQLDYMLGLVEGGHSFVVGMCDLMFENGWDMILTNMIL